MRKSDQRPRSADTLKTWRHDSGMNQIALWARFGVTQSDGGRYEKGRPLPVTLQLLIALHRLGRIDDRDLAQAADWLVRQKLAENEIGSQRRIDVPAGSPCPAAGWWQPAGQFGPLRYFKAGQVMEQADRAPAGHLWRWSPNQPRR